MLPLDELMTKGHIATGLLLIAAVLAYYIFVIRDREQAPKNKK